MPGHIRLRGSSRAVTRALRAIGDGLRRVIGVPDYDAYIVHHARHHLDVPAMTREEFARDVLARRAHRPGTRCC